MAEDLTLTSVTKSFGAFTAVDDLDLIVPQGSFFALLGPSGCGKTTTLRMVAGLEDPPRAPSRSATPTSRGSSRTRRPVNTVFQSYALFPHLSIADNVAFGLRRRAEGRRRHGDRDAGARGAGRAAEAPSRPALGRPAAARRAGPGAHQPAQGAAPRRAAGSARPQAAPPDADRAQADPDRGRPHLRPRHPRPGGGHDHGRHGRGDERGPDRADGCARGALRGTRDHVRRQLPGTVEPGLRQGDRRRRLRTAARRPRVPDRRREGPRAGDGRRRLGRRTSREGAAERPGGTSGTATTCWSTGRSATSASSG